MVVKIMGSKSEWISECASYVIEWATGMTDMVLPENTVGKLTILDGDGKATDNYRWLKKYEHLYIMNDLGKTIDKYTFN